MRLTPYLKLPQIHGNLSRQLLRFSTILVQNEVQTLSSAPISLSQLDMYTYLLEECLQCCKKLRACPKFNETPKRQIVSFKVNKLIHSQSVKFGIASKGLLGNAIVDLYAKCGDVDFAEKAFHRLEEKDYLAWNSILSLYSSGGMFGEVLERFNSMRDGRVAPNQFTYSIVSSVCARFRNLELGKQIHCCVIKSGFECDSFCGVSLIDLYSKCGVLFDARRVFDLLIHPDTISWTAMISAYVLGGFPERALECFEAMRSMGHVPDQVAFGTAINTCIGLRRLDVAWRLFSEMPHRNVVAWNVMITGHCKLGFEMEAITIFQEMIRDGIKPTRSTLGSVLSAIAGMANINFGVQVHAKSIKLGLGANVYVGSSLVSMYGGCNDMTAAKEAFDETKEKNVVLWNALLRGYALNGCPREVVELLKRMTLSGFQHDEFTYTSILSACASLGNKEMGCQLHSLIIKRKYASNLYVGNALVDMYAKCGVLEDAKRQFDLIGERDNVSWNAIIVGYVQEEEEEEALNMFHAMMLEGISPDEVSLASILSACANLHALNKGEQIHCFLIKYGLETSLYSGSSLIDMYSKCGVVGAAEEVFSCMPERTVISINALISGYAPSDPGKTISMFRYMLVQGLKPSDVTFACLLDACTDYSTIHLGRQIHCFILKFGTSIVDEFLAISVLLMYLNSQSKTEAIVLFSELPNPKSPILWTALISGLAQNGFSQDAFNYYHEMRLCDTMLDQATFASTLKACSVRASLQDGRKIHSLIVRTGFSKDELVSSALLDMYAKCGDVRSSENVFAEMAQKKDVIPWNSMIVGYAKNGFAENALRTFEEMKCRNIMPDEVTLLGILTACSHSGMVTEGRQIFDDLVIHYGVQPRADHYACMVDVYGRWGFLKEAEEFIEKLKLEPDPMIWSTYLSACRLHGDDIRGLHAAKKLIELDPQSSSLYVQLCNMYAASGNWEGVNSLRKEMIEKGVRKLPGCTWM
ncbi:OLC1v1016592C1 [Oldenlandia corymbosa var. corymbosa]|uniref:OLC1v1016592C1 n=1 Tax=Oldenlandia corymbosa var. corymbosa TaxID=529605 RepID=A0AAV1E5Y8_OLDCO|nr:OLC1v1016592C1 [Oldenlandia corymbosa var. corymbosa]